MIASWPESHEVGWQAVIFLIIVVVCFISAWMGDRRERKMDEEIRKKKDNPHE